MRANIVFEVKQEASGGGNQFLKALVGFLKARDLYTDDAKDADVIMFNSYQYIPQVLRLKEGIGAEKPFVHRIDGPIREYNLPTDKRDYVSNAANKVMADGTIFQSKWSRSTNLNMGLKENRFEAVIMNAPDSGIFHREGARAYSNSRKTRLVASSWSANWKKGFEVYRWLDENLDFDAYEMTFVGNSPIPFRNIRQLPPLPSAGLAEVFRDMDVYVTASQKDPCSNSLIEAMHCGLPAVALEDGGHPDIVGKGGELFRDMGSLVRALERVREDHATYRNAISLPGMEIVGNAYAGFLESIVESARKGVFRPKRVGILGMAEVKGRMAQWRLAERMTAASGKKQAARPVTEARV